MTTPILLSVFAPKHDPLLPPSMTDKADEYLRTTADKTISSHTTGRADSTFLVNPDLKIRKLEVMEAPLSGTTTPEKTQHTATQTDPTDTEVPTRPQMCEICDFPLRDETNG